MSAESPDPTRGGASFPSRRALLQHSQATHPHDAPKAPDAATSVRSMSYCESTSWACTRCSAEFDDKAELRRHARACELSEFLHRCEDCGEEFRHLSALFSHVDEMKCRHDKLTMKSAMDERVLMNGSVYHAVLYFDGAAVPNPGRGGAGYVLIDAYGRSLEQHSINIVGVESSTHQAEYCALIKGLQCASRLKIKFLLVRGSSELVINQMTAVYPVEDCKTASLHDVAVRTGAGVFSVLDYEWVPQRENREAEQLARRGSERWGDLNQVSLVS